LLAEYTPKEFYKLQQSFLLKKAKVALPHGAHIPGQKTTPEEPNTKTPPSYHNWHRSIRGIHQELLVEALDETEHHWVFDLNYNQLLTGGLKMVRLFPRTPMLADAFHRLKVAADVRPFTATINHLLKTTESHQTIDTDKMISIWSRLLSADKRTVKIPTGVLVKEFTNGALGTLDPFTDVFWPDQVTQFDKMMEGTFGGVGIQIEPHDGFLRVVSPLSGTPAWRAGIQSNDLITTVNGKSILGMSLDSVIHMIMGKPGTTVTLGIRRGKNPNLLIFHLKRAQIEVHSVEGFLRNPETSRWRYMIDPVQHIGYIRVTQFQSDTGREFKRAVKHLLKHHVRGIIIDLRYNPGGLLEIALRMCRMFLKNGVILSTYGRTSPKQTWYATNHPMVPSDIPMIVLVNQDSASASEIFSGAMHDRHRALIIGHRTYGKGSVQNIIPIGLNHKAILKLTMAHYYLPDGECVERNPHATTWGVQPNIVIPFSPAQLLALQQTWMHAEVLPNASEKATAKKIDGGKLPMPIKQEAFDTQLDTALTMMRLTLLQQAGNH
jgi:carboxyl-terminal processing protease